MRPNPRVGLIAALLTAACGPTPQPVAPRPPYLPPAPGQAASSPSPGAAHGGAPMASAPPAPPPAPWARVYRRACTDSATAPAFSPDGKRVASCGAIFDAERGRFLGPAPFSVLALLPDGRTLTEDTTEGGITVLGPAPGERVHDGGGAPQQIAVAADGSRMISFEMKDGEGRLVVRKLPSLERVRETVLERDARAFGVGFLADGREAVVADRQCREEDCAAGVGAAKACKMTVCADRAISVVEGGALVPLVTSLAEAALAGGGEEAAVVRKDGSAAVVALPDGRTLASLPAPSRDDTIDALAVNAAGDRVAVAAGGKLTILARRGDAFVEVLSAAHPSVNGLRFSADGRTLFTGYDLVAYREGATSRPLATLPYPVTLPPGFVALDRVASGWKVKGKDDREWSEPEEVQAMYFHDKLGATVKVIAVDPEEVGPEGTAEAWAARAAARFFPHLAVATAEDRQKLGFTAWGDAAEGRAMELHWHEAGGCDEEDGYGRLVERGGRAYLVRIDVPGDLKPERAASWVRAFFDEPLGPSPERAQVAVAVKHEEAKAKPKHARSKKKKKGRKKKKT